MGTKLHELLAVEADVEGKYKRIVAETTKDFKDKPALFMGSVRTLAMFEEGDKTDYPAEHQEMTTTVRERLMYTAKSIIPYFDTLFRKEKTNGIASSDVIVDGVVLMENVPATFLLGMENRLAKLREMYECIPTLPIGVAWEPDPSRGTDVYKMTHPEEKMKTAKKFQHQVLVPAMFPPEGHGGQSLPAQIEKWEEVENVGKFTKEVWTGVLPSAKKAAILERIDKLIRAVKQARQRANRADVVTDKIGDTIISFIHADL